MPKLPKLRKARQETLAQIALLEEMRRGSVTRQYVKSKSQSNTEPVFTGPYALFTWKKEGRTLGRRLHDLEEIRRLEHQVENYHTFQNLCRKLVDIGEQICEEKDKEQVP